MANEKLLTIEETLQASDIVTALTTGPYLIYSQMFEAPRRPLVFLAVCGEDKSLIGNNGNVIKFMSMTHLTATEASEATILSGGMTAADKTFTSASVTVDNVIYSATELTDILLEDYPKIDFVQKNLGNMGAAVLEKLDANVKDVLVAGGTQVYSGAALGYGNVVDALSAMENTNWTADDETVPFLIVSPDAAGVLMKDTTFVDARRYTAYEVAKMVEGEIGLFAGCRVLKTSLLNGTGYGFIVFPPDSKYGPVALIAWKREMTVKNDYFTKNAYSYYVASIRAKAVVTQALGVGKLVLSSSP
jgi:N4-gp56 family major capsid protein